MVETTTLETAMQLLKDHGWAVFFAFVCLLETALLVKVLLLDKKGLIAALEEERTRSMDLAAIIERRTERDRQMIEALGKLEATVKAEQEIQKEFLVYLRTRDQYQKRGG